MEDIEDLGILISTVRRFDPLGSSQAEKRFEEDPCSCEKCASACLKHPGFFDPEGFLRWIISECDGEIDVASLKTTIKKIFHLTKKDYYASRGVDLYMIRPSTVDETPGKAPRFFTYSKCSLLDSNGCRLSPQYRPIECSLTYCCKVQKHAWEKKEASVAWQTPLGLLILKIYDDVGYENYDNYDTNEADDAMTLMVERMKKLQTM